MIREESSSAKTSAGSAFLKHAADGFLFLSFLYISLNVIRDFRAGGNSWKQGDWLINNAAGSIRRGPLGSAIISIGDRFDLDPLLIVSVAQIALLALLIITFRFLVSEVRNPKIALLLIISPAIFTVFWIADPQGSVRKELIAFAGLSLYALGAVRANWTFLWIGVAFFCVSTLSHEAMVLFTPTFLALIFFSGIHKVSARQSMATIAVILCFSLFAFLFAIKNPGVEDTSAICAALTERGLSETICEGAIRWLSYDTTYGFQAVRSELTPHRLAGFIIAYLVALAPLVYVIWLSPIKTRGVMVLILLALPFVLLYPITLDWGRWMSFHIFSATIVLTCAIVKNRLPIHRTPSTCHLLCLVILAIQISPLHMIGIIAGGAAKRIASEFWRLL